MSSDTMYFNSSRVLSVPNKVNTPKKFDKKELQTQRKNKTRQEQSDQGIPEQQNMPNGQKPNFGNSNTRKNKNQMRGSPHKEATSNLENASSSNIINGIENTELLTKTLKDMLLSDVNSLGNNNMNFYNNNVEQIQRNGSKSITSPIPSQFISSPITTPGMNHLPLANIGSPAQVMLPLQQATNLSPMMIHPGLPPMPMMQGQMPMMYPPNQQMHPHQQMQMHPHMPQYQQMQHQQMLPPAYGNYTLSTPLLPQYMSPLSPMNASINAPMQQQIPQTNDLLQNQQQQKQQYHQQQHHQQQQYHQQQQQQHHQHQIGLQKETTSLQKPLVTIPADRVTNNIGNPGKNNKSKKYKNRGSSDNNSFAGASFTTNIPKLQNLPKPSFT